MNEKRELHISNQRLMKSWRQYKAEPNKENEAAFITELTTARFLVPVDRMREKSRKASRFLLVVTQEQERFLPAFTDAQEWETWPFQKVEAAVIAYEGLMQILSDDPQRLAGISINPFGQNLILNRNELAKIAELS